MTCDFKKYAASAIVAIVVILSIGAANAASCAQDIEKFQNALPRDENGDPTFVGTARQSIAALEHQPTPISVERAKKDARSQILRTLAQAQALDSLGRPGECREAMARAKILLSP